METGLGFSLIVLCAWLWFTDWLLALFGVNPIAGRVVKFLALFLGIMVMFGFLYFIGIRI